MKGIDVNKSFIDLVINQNPTKKAVSVSESTEVVKKEVVEEATEEETHTCPLCESELAEQISQEKIEEHVSFLLSQLQEALNLDGEDLDEESEEPEGDELDETEDE